MKNLLILDLDETLVYATEKEIRPDYNSVADPYFVFFRPHVERFLKNLNEYYEIAVWTSSSSEYAQAVVGALPFVSNPRFVWSRKRCTQVYDSEARKYRFIKDLKKIKKRGYDLNKVLVVDDSPKKLYRSYGNHIHIKPYFGDLEDNELLLLEEYLISIADSQTVRSMEKRFWRTQRSKIAQTQPPLRRRQENRDDVC
jgi:RNA polymerase II subunit A small phosphatase-like protein